MRDVCFLLSSTKAVKARSLTAFLILAIGVMSNAYSSARPEGWTPSVSQIEDLEGPLGATGGAQPRPLIPFALGLVKDFEGWVAQAYDDPAGYCTIGYGHLISKSRCAELDLGVFSRPLTKEAGTKLLLEDTVTSRRAIQSLVKRKLNDQQFGALSSFVFNVGKEKFAGSTMLKMIQVGDFGGAAKEFHRWVKITKDGKSIVLEGLAVRRNCEAALFSATRSPPPFKRENCQALGATPPTEYLIDIGIGEKN